MKTKSLSESLWCPSYVAKPNAELFGVVNKEGRVHFLKQSIKIDDTFINETKNGRPADERFRFTGKCVEGGCKHWIIGKEKCGLAALISQNSKENSIFPNCPIRLKCRWYAQEGTAACNKCSDVFRNEESCVKI
jgi:hypothetical protein